MKLSKDFTLEELTVTSTGLPNVPSKEEIERLILLCEKVLQPTRNVYGKRIIVSSGYRSPEINKLVKGSKTSQHMKAEAADITAGSKVENKKIFNIIKELGDFDQLINEYNYS